MTITVFGCGPDEAALFREVAPCFGVALTITEAVLTAAFSVAFWLIARTRGDFGAVFGSRPDERQRTIDLRATAAAGLAVGLLCIVMSVITLARGGDGNPWVAICAVFGAVYVIALAIFRR